MCTDALYDYGTVNSSNKTRQKLIKNGYTTMYIAVSEVLVTAIENGSQITSYPAHGDWLFITYYKLKSTDYAISIHNLVLQGLWEPQYQMVIIISGY